MNARCGLDIVQNEFGYDTIVHFEHHYGDVFETPETAERSEWYGVTSHPHARFDGLRPVIGAVDCLSAATNYRNRINSRLNDTFGVSPVEITGSYSMGAGEVSIAATYRLDDELPLLNVRATLLIYEDNVYYCCGPGGNDTWQHVTRVIHDQPVALPEVNDEVLVSATIPLDPSWNPSELHFVAYLQDLDSQEIIQGYIIPEQPAAVADLGSAAVTRIDAVSPNPVESGATVFFHLSERDAGAPVRLDLIAPDGRGVADLFRGTLEPGSHAVRWDRGREARSRLARGVYFLRLETREGTRNAKVLLLE